jgi:hypothetical protein
MAELRKNAGAFKGFPLLQYVSIGMEATGQTATQGGQTQPTPAPSTQPQNAQITSPSDAIAKSLGGMFGGFGRKKKQQQDQSSQGSPAAGQASDLPPAPPATPGSFMDMTTQVTSYSSDALDDGLFAIPEGYTHLIQPLPFTLYTFDLLFSRQGGSSIPTAIVGIWFRETDLCILETLELS